MSVVHSRCDKTVHDWTWILFLVSLWCFVPLVNGFPSNFPLRPEEEPEIVHKKPGCYMDRQHYQFGEQWNPVFLSQGLMVCIRCQCLPVEKKGVVQAEGRTMCRNIKDLCPVPNCPSPTLRPGKCCKACEGDDFEDSFSFQPNVFVNDVYNRDAESTEPEAKDFQALLVGHQVPSGPVPTRAIALVGLSIEGSATIRYSIRYSNLDRPKYLRILHINGNLIYKTPIVKEVTGDKKACGEWRNPSPNHLAYIREGSLLAVVTTSKYPNGVVAGRIKVASDKQKEVFSSLLADKSLEGGGAHASISYSPRSKTVSYSIETDDVVKKGRKGIFTVSIMKHSKVIYKTKGTALAKTTKLSGKWKVYKRSHRKQLARGRLRMRVKFSDGHVLIGVIQTKLTCNIFQAVLSGSQTRDKRKTASAGSVVIRMGDNGKLYYSARLANITQEVTKIRLEGKRRRKKGKMKTIGNLFPTFVRDGNSTFSGWANGTIKKLDADAIHGLLNNQLYISVKVSHHKGKELRGRLVTREHHTHIGHQTGPTTLVPVTQDALGGAGQAWLSIDSRCRLHFDVMYADTEGKTSSFKSLQIFLGNENGNYSGDNMIRLPFKKSLKKKFGYLYGEGKVGAIPDDAFRDLDKGGMFLMMMSTSENKQEETYRSNKGETMCQRMECPKLSCSSPVQTEGRCCPSCPHEDSSEMCQLEGDPRQYPLHSLWHPYLPMHGFSSCALCTCLPGKKVECYKQPCPTPNCPKSEWVPDGNNSCCYTCKEPSPTPPGNDDVTMQPQRDINMKGACVVNDQIRSNGERWHPHIHPFGYMKCFYCECQNGSLACGRVQCPVLSCTKRIRRRKVCCEECADEQENPTTHAIQKIDPPKKISSPVCNFANKLYKQGQTWNPDLYNGTETEGCVVCKCKSGQTQCRPKCPKVCNKNPLTNPCCKHCPDKTAKVTKQNDDHRQRKAKRKRHKDSTAKRKQRKHNKRRNKPHNKATKRKQTIYKKSRINIMDILQSD